jgi:hypothetical protein
VDNLPSARPQTIANVHVTPMSPSRARIGSSSPSVGHIRDGSCWRCERSSSDCIVAPGYTAAVTATGPRPSLESRSSNRFTATKVSDNQVEQTKIEAGARVAQTKIQECGKAFRQAMNQPSCGYRGEYGGGDRGSGYSDRRMIEDTSGSDSA